MLMATKGPPQPIKPHIAQRREIMRTLFGHSLYWACQIACWGGLWALFFFIFISGSTRQLPAPHLIEQTLYCSFGLIGTHLLRILFYWFDWNRLPLFALIPRVLVATILLGIVEVWGIRAALTASMPARPSPNGLYHIPYGPPHEPEGEQRFHSLPRFVWFEFGKCALTLFAWSAVYFGYQYQKQLKAVQLESLRLDAAVKEAELKALRSQVNPHFLFNSLNTIRALIDESPPKAREGVTRLAELFRGALRMSELNTIPLRVELQMVDAYLGLEQLRFEDKLKVLMDVDRTMLAFPVPPFLVQSLIENAFKHGVYTLQRGGEISCVIRSQSEGLSISITNPGRLAPVGARKESGLANARARLELIYGSQARLRLYQDASDRIVTEVFLPSTLSDSEVKRRDNSRPNAQRGWPQGSAAADPNRLA
jgi:two-component system, LytTR family, sensor kinase